MQWNVFQIVAICQWFQRLFQRKFKSRFLQFRRIPIQQNYSVVPYLDLFGDKYCSHKPFMAENLKSCWGNAFFVYHCQLLLLCLCIIVKYGRKLLKNHLYLDTIKSHREIYWKKSWAGRLVSLNFHSHLTLFSNKIYNI